MKVHKSIDRKLSRMRSIVDPMALASKSCILASKVKKVNRRLASKMFFIRGRWSCAVKDEFGANNLQLFGFKQATCGRVYSMSFCNARSLLKVSSSIGMRLEMPPSDEKSTFVNLLLAAGGVPGEKANRTRETLVTRFEALKSAFGTSLEPASFGA